jgi:hypothetical protein
MNARKPPTTYSAIKKEVAAELERQEPELFAKHAEMLIPQAMAVFLWTMTDS